MTNKCKFAVRDALINEEELSALIENSSLYINEKSLITLIDCGNFPSQTRTPEFRDTSIKAVSVDYTPSSGYRFATPDYIVVRPTISAMRLLSGLNPLASSDRIGQKMVNSLLNAYRSIYRYNRIYPRQVSLNPKLWAPELEITTRSTKILIANTLGDRLYRERQKYFNPPLDDLMRIIIKDYGGFPP